MQTNSSGGRIPGDVLDVWIAFLRAHAQLVRVLDAELVAEHGMPLSTYDVLVQLAGAPGRRLRMTELAEAVVISPSGITRLVDRLVRQGLVERRTAEADARGTYAVLTDSGLRRFRAAHKTHLAGVKRLFADRLSDGQLRDLAHALDALGGSDTGGRAPESQPVEAKGP